MADDEHIKKLESLQQYIPFLNNMIIQLKDPRKKNREQQLQKMVSLHEMITDKKKKLKLETLMKCEEVIVKLYNKVKSGATQLQQAQQSRNSSSPSAMTPCSPSPPPRDATTTITKKPVVIPTEKVTNRTDVQLSQSPQKVKTKVDIYSSAGDTFRAKVQLSKPSVFDRLGSKSDMDMSKPPISIEDLEALQDVEPPKVDTDKMSLNELNYLKKQIEDQLNKSESGKNDNSAINTTVRNTTILTKKAVEKSIADIHKKNDAKVSPKTPHSSVKPIKVVKDIPSIFGSALSSIDNKILEDVSKKEKERRNSVGSKKDEVLDRRSKESGDKHKNDKNKILGDKHKSKDLFRSDQDRKEGRNDKKSDFLSEKSSKEKTDRKSSSGRRNSREYEKKSRDRKNRSKDRDREKKSHYKDKSKKYEKKENREKSNNDSSSHGFSDSVTETVKEQSLTDGLLKLNEPFVKNVEEEKLPDTTQPTFKRLADKYNPKPRKASIDVSASSEISSPNIPLGNLGKMSNQPSSANTIPLNLPLLSPTNSVEHDINNYMKKSVQPTIPLSPLQSHSIMPNSSTQPLHPPNSFQQTCNLGGNMSNLKQLSNIQPISDQVNSILSNPNTTAIIHTVVNQFKVDQVPLMVNSNLNRNNPYNNQIQNPNYANSFHQADVQYSNSIQTPNMVQQSNMSYFRSNQSLQQQSQTSHLQNFPQRSVSQVSHQFDYTQQLPYFGQGSSTHNSFNQAKPMLPAVCDNFQGRSQVQVQPEESSYSVDRDARPSHVTQDWRRWSRDSREQDSRDPRVHRDFRSYREETRPFRRDSRESRDPREQQDRGRPIYRDPRLNRFYTNSRNDGESAAKPPSPSREKDDGETFTSPLNSLYSGNDNYRKTGKGYGVQSFKIPKIKKEDESIDKDKTIENCEKEDDLNPPTLSPQLKTSDKTDEEGLHANVSSSTEADNKEIPNLTKSTDTECEKISVTENTEISSTNEIAEQVKREDIVEPDQTEIINKFLKKLLENETTRAAASMFIDNVSSSLDDEKLKVVVQTVKRAAIKEELDEKPTASKEKKEDDGLKISKKKPSPKKTRKMRPKTKLRARIITDDDDDEDSEEANDKEEEKPAEDAKCDEEKQNNARKEKDEEISENEGDVENKVFVTVGERTKSRKRTVRGANLKKKKHKSELDLLHEDIQEMFIRDGVLTATGKRMCRLINDEEKDKIEEKPPPPAKRGSRRAKAITIDTEKIKAMKNVCVVLPKISVERLGDIDDENQRYSLRRSSKASKSYVEVDSDEEKERKRRAAAAEEKEQIIEMKETRLRDSTKRNSKCYAEVDDNEEMDKAKQAKEEKIVEQPLIIIQKLSDTIQKEEKTEEPVKEKLASTAKRVVNRKRAKAWASGVILKKKQKRTVIEAEPEQDPSSELDKSLDFIEPDKNYYSLKASHCKTDCKLCDFSGKNITLHYRMEHTDSEILSSRLSPQKAEESINESIELNLDDCESLELLPRRLYTFKCRFCDLTMNTKISCFYDHISTHTGEYRHNCSLCPYGVCSAKALSNHYEKAHNKTNDNYSCEPVTTKIYGYICLDCNFVQIQKKIVDNHVNIYHLGEGKKIRKIYMSTMDYLIKDKNEGKKRTANRIKKPGSRRIAKPPAAFRSKRTTNAESLDTEDDVDDIPISKRKKITENDGATNLIPKESKEDSLIDTKPKKESKEQNIIETESDHLEIEIKKEIDMTVFTCATNIQEENQKIEEDRLKRMTELNETVKTSRQCKSNFVEQLSNRLRQEENENQEKKSQEEALPMAIPELVMVKNEPMDLEPESEMILEADLEPDIDVGLEFSPKKVSKIINSPASSPKEVVQRENIKIQGMIQKLQGILREPNGPPPLALLDKCNDEGAILSAGFLNIIKQPDGIEYACRIPSCLITSKERDVFLTHWDQHHVRINESHSSTKCLICGCEVKKTRGGNLLRNFFNHVEQEHLGVAKRNLLKARRLSGDLLSIPQDEKVEKSDDNDKVEENPFPFKISGVMSLAEDTSEIPPLSPINGKSTSSILITDIVLKESKLTLQEQQVARKSPFALQKFRQCPQDLYKCPQYSCQFSTNLKNQFDNHINEHSGELESLMACVYCDVKTPLNNASLHIDVRHLNCSFSCNQCLYRALTKEYVIVHLKMKHKGSNLVITSTPPSAPSFKITKKEFSIEESCLPYICGHKGCEAKFLFQNEYLNHVKIMHCNIFYCGFKSLGAIRAHCTYQCYAGDEMIKHWRVHNCYHFSCLLCKMGFMDLYLMLEHYAITHPNMEPSVVDRRQSPITAKRIQGYSEDAFNSIKHIGDELLACVNFLSGKVSTETKTLSVVDPPNRVDSPKKLDSPKKITLLPLSVLQGNTADKKIIIIPKSVEGIVSKPMKIVNSKAGDKSKAIFTVVKSISKSSDTDKVVDETKNDDVDLNNETVPVDPLSLDNDITTAISASGDESDSQDISNEGLNVKRFGLVGYQLYRCAFCDISFSNTKDFKAHINQSKQCRDETNSLKQFKCVHCERQFKNGHGLLDHIQYHGQLRFGCSLCVQKFPSTFSLKFHMRNRHNVTNTVTTPVIANKSNFDSDEFILRPVPIAEPDMAEGSSLEFSPNKKDVFSPEEIDKLPQRYIFTADLKCSLCSYSTKVKTNLVRHLQFHSREKAVPAMAPVNPVPCLDKNEKMFDKMTNLAISSMTGSSRMGGAVIKTEEPAMKHVEAPAFIPSHRRYACCASGCNYLCPEETNLRHHLFTLHVQEPSFTCVHCQVVLKTDIEAYLKHLKLHDSHLYKCQSCSFMHNLRHKVDKHSVDKHPEVTNNTITIRAMGKEPAITDHQQPIPISTPNTESQPSNIKWTKPWHCGMCKYRCAAKSEIVAHIYFKHDVNMQFKCTLCNYKTDDKSSFEDHFKGSHPDSDVDIIYVYYKSEGTGLAASGNQKQFDTTPLWQRDRPRVRHIRGILFEESSQKTLKRNATVRNISSAASSNLDLSIEAVATGMDAAATKKVEKIEGEGTPSSEDVQKNDSIIILDDDDEDVDMGLGTDGDLFIDVDNMNVDSNNIDGKVALDADENEIHSVDVLFRKYGEVCATSGRAFKCPLCLKYKTKKVSNFIYHLLVELKQYRFKCRSCEYVCVSFDNMVFHCQDEHNSYLIKNIEDIPLRKSVIYWLQLVVRHQTHDMLQQNAAPSGDEYQSSGAKFQCEFCKRWFRTTHLQKEHELYHWSEHSYICNYCSLEFPSLNQMFEHNFVEHKNSPCDAMVNGPSVEKILANLKQNTASGQQSTGSNSASTISEESSRAYNCPECNVTEKNIIDMQKHCTEVHNMNVGDLQLKVVTKSKMVVLYSCSYCHERASDKELRIHHEDKHKNLKFSIYQYICLECSQTFLNVKDLRSHHNKEHPLKKMHYSCVENKCSGLKEQFICSKCPFRSGTVGGIRNHIKKHLRPVDCKTCGATFIYPTEARAHHNKEHMHSLEAVEDSKERLVEYENLVKEIVSERDRRIRGEITPPTVPPPPPPSPPAIVIPPQKKMFARKSTAAPFIREPKPEIIEIKK